MSKAAPKRFGTPWYLRIQTELFSWVRNFTQIFRWTGKGPDGKPIQYVQGSVLKAEAPRLLSYTYAMGSNKKESRVTIELMQETEATRVKVTHDDWAEDDETYGACADGWPRILSRLKTLIETGKTFKPH
jgi:uncharacterized protein YndB with AHSA1/START domain